VRKLEMMLDAPFPSGKEMHHLTEMNSYLADILDQRKNRKKMNRSSANKYVLSRNRSYFCLHPVLKSLQNLFVIQPIIYPLSSSIKPSMNSMNWNISLLTFTTLQQTTRRP